MLQYLNTNILLLKYLGFWLEKKYFEKTAYNIYSIFNLNFLIILDVFCLLLNLRTITENLEISTSYLTILSTKIIGLIKLIMFIKKRRIVHSVLISLNFKELKCKNNKEEKIMKKSFITYEISFKGYFIVVGLCISLFLLVPFFKKQEKILPFNSWYPFNYKDPYWYVIAYIHQMISTIILSFSQVGIDSLSAGLMTIVSSQCEILCEAIRSLDESVTDFDEFFRGIAEHHKIILNLSEQLNELFSIYGFAQMCLCVLLLCTAMFRLSVVDPGSVEFFTIMCFIFTIAIQLAMYCWFGNKVTLKSSELHSAAFQCNWVGSPISFQKKLIIFMRKTAEPINIRVLHFFPMSIVSFSAIMKSSWSYFVVLQRVHDKM